MSHIFMNFTNLLLVTTVEVATVISSILQIRGWGREREISSVKITQQMVIEIKIGGVLEDSVVGHHDMLRAVPCYWDKFTCLSQD